MHAVLLIAHGSRREASNEEVRGLAARLGQLAADRFDCVLPAFLELAEPDIVTGVANCVAAGASTVTVVPYFLSAGRHVAQDIPGELEKAGRIHPQVDIRQSHYLGMHEAVPELLLKLALDDASAEPVAGTVRASA